MVVKAAAGTGGGPRGRGVANGGEPVHGVWWPEGGVGGHGVREPRSFRRAPS